MGRSERTGPTFALFQRACEGDEEAFGCLLGKYRMRLESLVHTRLGPSLRAKLVIDEIVQETSLGAFRSIGSFNWQGEESFFRWLSAIAESIIRDRICRLEVLERVEEETKLKGSDPGIDETNRQDLPEPDQVSPPPDPLHQERLERLNKELNSLSPDYREVIILALLKRLPIREIAQRMNRSVDAVSMLLLRAVRKLKRDFGEDSEGLGFHALLPGAPPRAPGRRVSPPPAEETMPDGYFNGTNWFPTARGGPAFNPGT